MIGDRFDVFLCSGRLLDGTEFLDREFRADTGLDDALFAQCLANGLLPVNLGGCVGRRRPCMVHGDGVRLDIKCLILADEGAMGGRHTIRLVPQQQGVEVLNDVKGLLSSSDVEQQRWSC